VVDEPREDQFKEQVAKALSDFEERSKTQLATTLAEVQSQRVISAEKFVTRAQIVLGMIAFMVTIVLALAGYIGIRSIFEQSAFEKKMQDGVKAVDAEKQQVDDQAQKAEQELAALQFQDQTLRAQLNDFETRFASLSMKGGLANASPTILQTPNRVVGVITLGGRNFGKKQGSLYAYVQEGSLFSASIQIESSSILRWTDKNLSVSLSDSDQTALFKMQHTVEVNASGGIASAPTLAPVLSPAMEFGTRPPAFLCFQVVTADSIASEYSAPIVWHYRSPQN
jgi:hypothetical protein